MTEYTLPVKAVIAISDHEQSAPTRLTWIDLMDSQIDYEDIQNTAGLTEGEREILQVFQADNLSYKEIIKMYNISINTFKRIQKKVRKIRRLS
ncbi:hypothetical protein KA005_04100 [bacterium]|nr:hypothetical protein [bacterium]